LASALEEGPAALASAQTHSEDSQGGEIVAYTAAMAQKVCPLVSAEDRARLEAIVADRNRAQKHVARARIILASAERLNVAAGRQTRRGRPAGSVALAENASSRLASRACCAMPPASPAKRP
jgi:hypothetical protein